MGGYSYQKFDRNGIFASGRGFSTNNLEGLANQLEDTYFNVARTISGDFLQFGYDANTAFVNRIDVNSATPFTTETLNTTFSRPITAYSAGTFDNFDELQSFFTRINYSYDNKYLFTGTFRADGSSKFGPENQYGFFPSGAFAWKIDEEDFVG